MKKPVETLYDCMGDGSQINVYANRFRGNLLLTSKLIAREAPALILQPDLLPVAKVRQSTPKTKVPRKKRSDALAYKLSPAQGAEITRQISAGASYRKIVALCASWGVKTSLGALTEYLRPKPGNVANSN